MLADKAQIFRIVFINLVVFIFGIGFTAHAQSQSIVENQKQESEINEILTSVTYCNLPLSPSWKLANLTFYSLYSFRVDKEGKVFDIKKLRDEFVGEQAVKSCISKWVIKGIPENIPFVVYFRWEHRNGWTEQKISGKGFTQTMHLDGIGLGQASISKDKKNP